MKENTYTFALAGNPNTGKSTLFNALTGLRQHTGNWSGKTVLTAQGICKNSKEKVNIVDLPGCYSIFDNTGEEKYALKYICGKKCDGIIVLCDCSCLERSLVLALQIKALTSSCTVCINFADQAEKKGIVIDVKKLSSMLSMPVTIISAKNKKNIDQVIKKAIQKNKESNFFWSEEAIEKDYAKEAEIIAAACVNRPDDFYKRDLKTDKILTGRFWGYLVMSFLFVFVFWVTINGAGYITQYLNLFFGFLKGKIVDLLNPKGFLGDFLIEGIYSGTVWIIAAMLPPMAIFFPLFTILEDLGYLPRMAFVLDGKFKKCKGCGKQALSMCMGFGCNAVGVTGCRIIDSPRERLIAIITNSFVPCNGRFPAIIAICTIFFGGILFLDIAAAVIFVFLGIAMTFIVSRILSATLLKGTPASYVLELPPYRKPQFFKVIIRSLGDRTVYVLGRALIFALPASGIIWLLANINAGEVSLLFHITLFFDGFASFLGINGVILAALVFSLPANELFLPILLLIYNSSGSLADVSSINELKELFAANGWTILTAVNTLILTIFHWPCSTTLLTIKKETKSVKWTIISFLLPTLVGFLLCFAVKIVFMAVGV